MSTVTVRFAYWKLYTAVLEMATSERSKRGRLEAAVNSGLHYMFPLVDREGDLPPEIITKIAQLQDALTARGEYRQTIRHMSAAKMNQVMGHIITLYAMVAGLVQFKGPEEPELQED